MTALLWHFWVLPDNVQNLWHSLGPECNRYDDLIIARFKARVASF